MVKGIFRSLLNTLHEIRPDVEAAWKIADIEKASCVAEDPSQRGIVHRALTAKETYYLGPVALSPVTFIRDVAAFVSLVSGSRRQII